MAGIPSELTSAVLTVLTVGGAWLATILSRKGKREDLRIAETNQTFNQMKELSEARKVEIERRDVLLAARDAEIERLRTSWEARWDRQMKRCRDITEPLVHALKAMRDHPGSEALAEAEAAQRALSEHNDIDHAA